MQGGFWAELFSFSLANPPAGWPAELVARLMPDPGSARKETIVQRAVAAAGARRRLRLTAAQRAGPARAGLAAAARPGVRPGAGPAVRPRLPAAGWGHGRARLTGAPVRAR